MQIHRYAICSVLITCFVIFGPLVSRCYTEQLGGGDAQVDAEGGICFAYENETLVASDCPQTDVRTPDPLIRRLLGLRTCWWSASADDLQRISGVGARTAAGLARYRDVGGRPTIEQLDTIHRIGESTATKIASAVTTDCRTIAK